MARRKPHSGEELPFVALMDTMTNVVGVLIIVLVMVGIGLANSVRKVLSDLPPVTVEEHATLQKEVEDATPKHDPQQVAEEIAKLEVDAKKSADQLATMDVTKDQQNIKVIDLDALTKQLAEKKKERAEKKAATDALLAQLAKLKAQLDTTPVYQPPPAVVVKLPNPRPLPEKAVIQRFLIAGGRIIYTNDEDFSRLIEQELHKNEATLTQIRETVKGPDGKPVMVADKFGRPTPQRKIVYDAKKVADYFARVRLGTRELKVEVTPTPATPLIPLKLTPTPEAGETIAQAKALVSNYQTLLRKFKADSRTVVWFHVFHDSIETYLAARDLADQLAVPAGWELYGANFYTRYLPPEFLVDYTPPPAAPAPATPAVVIAPPKTTLD